MKKKIIKIISTSVISFAIMFAVSVFGDKVDYETGLLCGGVVAAAVLALWAFGAITSHFEKKKASKAKIKAELAFIEKQKYSRKIENDQFEYDIKEIMDEESKDDDSNPMSDFLLASVLLGLVISAIKGVGDFGELGFWIRVSVLGAFFAGGIKLLLNKSKEKEIENLKKITVSIYFKLKKLQEKYSDEETSRKEPKTSTEDAENADGAANLSGKIDGLAMDVARYGMERGALSASEVQRHFSVGFSRAGKILDQLERLHVCGPKRGSKFREMLVNDEQSLYELWPR